MIKGVVLGIAFFLLGFSLNVPLNAEVRFATTDSVVESTQRIPFDSIKVYPDAVNIEYSGLKYAKVKSDSMAPWLTHDSVVFEKVPESAGEIHVGDVISFYEPSEDATVLHMVVDITDEGFVTKGLANDAVDPWIVPFKNVKGIMVGSFR